MIQDESGIYDDNQLKSRSKSPIKQFNLKEELKSLNQRKASGNLSNHILRTLRDMKLNEDSANTFNDSKIQNRTINLKKAINLENKE